MIIVIKCIVNKKRIERLPYPGVACKKEEDGMG